MGQFKIECELVNPVKISVDSEDVLYTIESALERELAHVVKGAVTRQVEELVKEIIAPKIEELKAKITLQIQQEVDSIMVSRKR